MTLPPVYFHNYIKNIFCFGQTQREFNSFMPEFKREIYIFGPA